MMSLEGHLNIVLPRDTNAPTRIDLKEPVDITTLLTGRPPEAASQLIPALYSLCGTAHAAAAVQAVESANGIEPGITTHQIRTCLVLMERAREHLLRICLKWPELTGRDPDTKTAQTALKLLPAFRKTVDPTGQAFSGAACNWQNRAESLVLITSLISLAENRVFGEELSAWLDRKDHKAMKSWAGQRATGAAQFMDALLTCKTSSAARARPLFLSESSLSDPFETAGEIPETTVFDRLRHHPALNKSEIPSLADRYLARLIDLAETAQELYQVFLDVDAPASRTSNTVKPGVGFAETARGRLTHVVDLQDGKVANYKIISPTRWNFASRGVATRYLDAIPKGPDSARVKHADLVVGAIDPCVAYEVRIH